MAYYNHFNLFVNPKVEHPNKEKSFDCTLMPIPNFRDAYRIDQLSSNCYPKELEWHSELKSAALKKHENIAHFIEKSYINDSEFENQLKAIIGEDERRHVTGAEIKKPPYSSIGRLDVIMPSGKSHSGSGTYIGNNKVLTAAHVIFDTKTNQQAAYVRFTPQKDGNSEPFGSFSATELLISERFRNLPDNDLIWDWAVLKVNGLVGKVCPTPVAGSRETKAQTSGKNLMEIAGYPGDKGGDKMYTAKSTYLSMDYWKLLTWVDTNPGQSGGPVLLQNAERSFNQIVGVWSGWLSGPNGPINQATRINNQDIMEMWKF